MKNKQESFKRQIRIINKSMDNSVYEKYKDYVLNMATDISDSLDFDAKIDIIMENEPDKMNNLSKSFPNGYSYKKNGHYIVGIYQSTLERIPYDDGLVLLITMYHEFGHIYDFEHTMKNKYCNINIFSKTDRTIPEYLYKLGHNYWTEFFAYYFTFKHFKHQTYNITFLKLVKYYEILENEHNTIIKNIDKLSDDEKRKVGEEYIDKIDDLCYSMTVFLAGYINNKVSYYKYAESTKAKPQYKKLVRITSTLLHHFSDILLASYKKGMRNKLMRLGDCFARKIYIPFNVQPIKINGKIRLSIFSDDDNSED